MNTYIDSDLKFEKDQPMIGFFTLYKYWYKLFLGLGIASSMIAGLSIPLFLIFMDDLFDSFKPGTDPQETYGKVP